MKKLNLRNMAATVACFAAAMTFSACEDNSTNNNNNQMAAIEKGSVKWDVTHKIGAVTQRQEVTYTFDNFGKRFRSDAFILEPVVPEMMSRTTIIQNQITKKCWFYGVDFNNPLNPLPTWSDMKCEDADSAEIDFTITEDVLKSYRKLPDMTIIGKRCDAYEFKASLTYDGITTTTTTIVAYWEGLNLYNKMEIKITGGETTVSEWIATSATFNVPDVAFTQTLDISWHP